MNQSNIVLIGMRGSGKTTIAKILAEKLNKSWIDLDVVTTERIGMDIPTTIEQCGWGYFRDQEAESVQSVSQSTETIIATGGGVVLRDSNMEALQKGGIIFYLKASAKTLVMRIGDDPNRPSLIQGFTQAEEVHEILRRRESLYQQWTYMVIDTETLNAEETANQILNVFGGVS